MRDADLPKSGIKGISWSTAPQRWKVAFYFKGKSYYNGEYKSLSDAELALSELKSRLGVVWVSFDPSSETTHTPI